MPHDSGLTHAAAGLLIVLLVCAAWLDCKTRRIPNALVMLGVGSAAVIGAFAAAFAGAANVSDVALSVLFGCAVGLLALLPLYAVGACGAGDVKLMAMVGAFLGPANAAAAVLATFIAGGFFALWYRRRIRPTLKSGLPAADAAPRPRTMPYAPAIAAGTLVCLAITYSG